MCLVVHISLYVDAPAKIGPPGSAGTLAKEKTPTIPGAGTSASNSGRDASNSRDASNKQ